MKQNLLVPGAACVFMALCSTHGNQLAAAEKPMNILVPLIINDPRHGESETWQHER